MNEAISILEGSIKEAQRTIAEHQEHIESLLNDGFLANIPKWKQEIADLAVLIYRLERAVAVLREAKP